jgi:hypothetical protein
MDDINFASATETDGGACEEWRADLPDFDNMEKFQRYESHFLGLYYRAVNTPKNEVWRSGLPGRNT